MKTIISVDGATPNVAMAEKYGMRYVHLPHGYDEFQLSVVKNLPKPSVIYRGRFIFIVIMANIEALRRQPCLCGCRLCVLERCVNGFENVGTNPHYRGLYQALETRND